MIDPHQNPKTTLCRNTLSILIPVYNERAHLRMCVECVLGVELPMDLQKEIIIVDDASDDGTRGIVQELALQYPDNIKVLFHDVNRGKGAAIRTAIKEMTGQFVIIQDADLEYDPNEYTIMLHPILQGHADVVYGSRFANRAMRRVFSYHHSLGNKFLTQLSNVMTGLDLSDMETCYKAFRADILKSIPIRSDGFGIEPEITSKIAKRGCIVYEVPISYRGRSYSEGKKINWKDGVCAIYTIIKFWLLDDSFNKLCGEEALHTLSKARLFQKWLVSIIKPYLGLQVLEVGSGIGTVNRYLPKKGKLILTDKDLTYLERLQTIFKGNDLVDVKKLDLNCQEDFDFLGKEICDTVICMNVLEHIKDDKSALERLRGLLVKGGTLVCLVPQYERLYGSYDQFYGHYRRYSKKTLTQKVNDAGFEVVKLMDFNFLSIPGWWFNSCFLKRKQFARWQIKFFDMLVPFQRIIEYFLPLPGLSLICIAKRCE